MISLRDKVLRNPTPYRDAFFGPVPDGVRCYELLSRSEGVGVGSVVVADDTPHATLLEAFFSLARCWRATASRGWIGLGAPRPLDLDEAWASLWHDIETGDRGFGGEVLRFEFVPMKVAAFARETARIVDRFRSADPAYGARLLVDNAETPGSLATFEIPVRDPYRYALTVEDRWNSKLFVAETAAQRVLAVWSTSA